MGNLYPGTVYRGGVVIDNRMDGVSIILGRPTNEYQGSVVIDQSKSIQSGNESEHYL